MTQKTAFKTVQDDRVNKMLCIEIHSSKLAHQREVGLPYTVKTSQNVIQHPSMRWIATLRTASAAIMIIHESRSPLAGPPGFHTCAGPMRGLWLLRVEAS
jgi:hypothetical protein